jgi:hypothetical protein
MTCSGEKEEEKATVEGVVRPATHQTDIDREPDRSPLR